MAHQAHNLPWKLLADNFKYRYENTSCKCQTNLFPSKIPQLETDLSYFAKAFKRTIDEHSKIERSKYAENYDPPKGDEEVFSEAIAEKIKCTLRQSEERGAKIRSMKVLENRKISFWFNLMPHRGEDNCRPLHNTLEPIKVLLLHSEMDVLLRLASHHALNLGRAWERPFNEEKDYGLKAFVYPTFMVYICLNILLQKPELYDEESRKIYMRTPRRDVPVIKHESHLDYRLTRAYQLTLLYCTQPTTQTLPHQVFFGLSHQLDLHKFNERCGHMPFARFKSAADNGVYSPHQDDIAKVMRILMGKGLPAELCLDVIEFADYTPSRRMTTADDPLHMDNSCELRKYLKYCWQLLVRVDMLMRLKNEEIDWEHAVKECVWRLFIERSNGVLKLRRRESAPHLAIDDRTMAFCSCCYLL
ncbi:hypothetical protein N7520_006287 [Penicillium odoratum]|uniref:uncharacterized protein n=1 Tax=Penicillium odoratum TaxID=1167516 RepID=UPI002546C332|nr:uncharacterized protein N7520_006287 [Penicillium odoratum]KAJ5759131.1 hypothetical protein N7520_006287 [Penicillium odoratum]